MTPRHFSQAMDLICKGDDFATVKRDGVALINNALGDFAELYLSAVEQFMGRLEELNSRGPHFSAPTKESISQAKSHVPEGREGL